MGVSAVAGGRRQELPTKREVLPSSPADDAAGQAEESFVDVVAEFPADAQAAKPVQREAPLDHPSVHAQPRAVFGAVPRDDRADSDGPDLLAVPVVVVPAVGVNSVRPSAGPFASPGSACCDRRQPFDFCVHHLPSGQYGERHLDGVRLPHAVLGQPRRPGAQGRCEGVEGVVDLSCAIRRPAPMAITNRPPLPETNRHSRQGMPVRGRLPEGGDRRSSSPGRLVPFPRGLSGGLP